MTDLNEMWTELERYQPYAERHGFGDAWLRMTTERTEEAACAATYAAARATAWAAARAQQAVDCIRKAIEKEQT